MDAELYRGYLHVYLYASMPHAALSVGGPRSTVASGRRVGIVEPARSGTGGPRIRARTNVYDGTLR
jgi:hypothetical protein